MEEYSNSGLTPQQIMAITYAFIVPFIIVSVIIIIACWKLYAKAGKPGWASIVPVYGSIIWLRIVGKPAWWTLFLILPSVLWFAVGQHIMQPMWLSIFFVSLILNLVFAVWITNLMGKSFGQSLGFTFGLVLLPFVFYPILAFSNYPYIGPAGLKTKGESQVPPAPPTV